MKVIRIVLGLIMMATGLMGLNAQNMSQVVRGKIYDSESNVALPYATFAILTTDPVMGTTSGEDGSFRLENVPVGRHNIQVSFLGYKTKVIPEIMITTGKEVVLNIGLKESITKVEEVTVKAFAKKDRPINSMATLSARTFSVEEAQRYAGGFDDPARLASSFAGVSTGYLDDNGIIVRGNAPKGLLWRLEGVEISNPNHFAGMTTFGGGGVSALSSLMLANSDFYTGAFPSEYGNAMSGVFDIKLRTGNNEKHEHAVQIGALGLDISSEGPFSNKSGASYLFNYRYSTFGLIKPVLPEEANVPIYQDLCFKFNIPTQTAGIFSLWGLVTDDKINFDADMDTSLWIYDFDREVGNAKQKMGALGLNHRYIIGSQTYINTSLSATGDYTRYKGGMLDENLSRHETENIKNINVKYSLTSTLNHKISAKHTNRTGFIYNVIQNKNLLEFAPENTNSFITTADTSFRSSLIQFYTQSRIQPSDHFRLNLGMHIQYFSLNKEVVYEPRVGLTYMFSEKQSVSLAYGKHSRIEPLGLYFARVESNNEITFPNTSLNLTKSHHIVLSYDLSIHEYLRLKIEPYAQFLYDVPVIQDSTYSTINMEADWYFNDVLTNDGTGTNYGIDLTLERFLKDGYYYLLTASLFESKYVDGKNIERDTRYNTNYVCNLLIGKEWVMGPSKNKFLGVNARFNFLGGQRTTPLDRPLSLDVQDIRYDDNRAFEARKPSVHHLNFSVTYRKNRKSFSSIWALQVLNALATKEFYGYAYNEKTGKIDADEVAVVVPSISYKIEF